MSDDEDDRKRAEALSGIIKAQTQTQANKDGYSTNGST